MNNCDYVSAYPKNLRSGAGTHGHMLMTAYRGGRIEWRKTPKMKIDFQWPYAIMFSVVFAGLSALVYSSKLHPEVLTGMLLWLAPSPISKKHEQ